MKTDRTVKAGSGSSQAKPVKRAGRSASKPTLKSNGKHLLTPYEYAPVGVVEVSPQGNYIGVNDAFCRITGYSKAKLRKLGFKDITHPEDRGAEAALYEQLVAGEIPFYRLEKRYIRKDGTVLWVELTRSAVHGGDGEVLHTVGIVLDISERKKSEAQLRWQAQLLAELGDAVIATDGDFVVTGWNSAAERIYGWKADEILGKNVDEILQTDLLGKSLEQVESETRRTGQFEGEVSQLRKDGTRVVLEARTVVMRDDHGTITGYVSVNRDITPRRQAEQALRESQQRLAATYQYAPVGIVQCTTEGRYFDANEEFCRLLGFEKAELVQGAIKDFTHEDDYPIDIKLHQQLVEGKIPYYRLEKRFLRRGGGYTWVELTRSLVRAEDGTPLYTIGAVLDISDRKHVERVLRESVERLRLATQAARMFMWEWDLRSQQYTVDDNFEQVVGFSGGLLPRGTAESIENLMHPQDRQALIAAVTDAIERRTDLHSFQIRIINPENGQTTWLELSGKVIYDEEGRAVRILGVSQNITESKKTQEEIAVISRLPAQDPNPVMRISPQGAILYANPASAPLLEDWQRQTNRAIPEQLQTAVREAFDRDTRMEVELAHGSSYFSCTLAPILEAGYVNFYGKDIIERKRAENALAEFARQQEALYHLSDRLHRTDSLEEVCDAALDAILSALQCSRASVLLFDEKNVMRFVAWRGLSDAYRRATDGHSPWTPESRDPSPITINDILSSDLDEPLRAVIEAEGIGALAFIPLVFHGKLIGKFMVYYDEVHRFSDEEVELSLTIAYQLAAGIERKRADVQLRQSEERYRTIVDTANEGIWFVNREAETVYLNEPMARTLGYSPADMLGRKVPEFCFPEDVALAQTRIASNYQGNYEHFDFRFRRRDGSEVLVLGSTSPVRDAAGQVIGALGMFVDITERKRAEEALRIRARQQETVARLGELAVRERDVQHVFDRATAMIAETLEIEYCKVLELLPGRDALLLRSGVGWTDGLVGSASVSAGIESQAGYTLMSDTPVVVDDLRAETRFSGPPLLTEHGVVSGMSCIIRGADGRPWGVLGAHTTRRIRFGQDDVNFLMAMANILGDAIHRHQAEKALRESEARYRAVVESQVEMVCRFEPDGKILFVNSAYARARATGPEDLIGRSFWDYVSDEDRPSVKAMLERLTPEAPEIHIENRFHTLEGERWTLWTNRGLKFDASGRLLEAQSSGIDITERKNAEEELQRSEERERMRAAQLEAIMESAPAVIWMATDPQCSVITGNRASYEMLRLPPDTNASLSGPQESRPTSFTLLSGGRVLPVDELPVQRAARGEEVRDLELEICFDNDSSFYLLGNATPLRDAQNNLTGAVAAFVDITARKQAEQRLALLAEISELTREFDDPDELMYSVSKRVGEYLRLNRCLFNEIDVESDREFVHRDYHDGVPSVAGVHKISDYSSIASAEMRAGKTVVNRDSQIDPRTAPDYERTYGPNQERAYVAIPLMREDRWVASFWVSDSQPRHWTRDEVSLLETIAERTWTVVEKLRITQTLRASEALYRTIARSVPGGGVYVVDENFRYLVAEGSVTEAFGLTREMLEGRTVMEAFPDERGRRMEERLKRTFAGETVGFETKHNGRVYWTQQAPLYDSLGQAIILTIDITERKLAEEALRESEERFRAILRQATAGIVRKDAEGRLIFVNQAFCNMLGHTEAELLGKTMWDFMHEEDIEENRRLYQHMMTEGLPFKLERRLLREDGSIIWVDASVSPIMDARGRPQSAVTVEVDITGRKQAEEALRRNEKMFSTLVNAAPFGVYFIDSEFRLLAVNKGSGAVFSGIDPLIGRDFAEVLRIVWPEPFATSAIERFRHTLRTGESFVSPPVVEKRGNVQEIQAYDWQIHRITLADGTYGVVCYFYDLTKQMRMEAAVRASEERYRNLFELVPVAVYSCDASGLIQEYNYRAVELWGREPARNDPHDRYCGSYKLFSSDGRPMPHDECPMARVLRGESLEPHELEVVVEREDRTRRSVIAHPLLLRDEQGEITGAINCLYDFTERKQAEEALQQLNAQLEDRVLTRTAKLRAVNERLREEIAERRKAEEALRESESAARANEKKLSTLFDLLPVGISFLDPQGKIIQMNPALANILKLSQEQMPDQAARIRQYIRADGSLMQPGEFASARALAEARTIYNTETGVVLENGETIWTSVSAAPVAVADVGAAVVTVDITERKQAERALQESRERLQILSQRLVEVQEDERRAIARELHDRVGQTLAALNINLIIINGQLEGKVDEQVGARLSDSMKLVAETITLVRDVMSNLRPSVLDDYGLEAALQSHIDEYISRYEIRVMLHKPERPLPRLGPSIEMTFLRIAQEALMNIARHAQASQVQLALSREGDSLCMAIQDDGKGIQSWQDASRPGSHGLTIMRERAEAFGGVFQVSSAPGQGTRIEVRIPFEQGSLPQSEKEIHS